ncbi:MAG: chemotaxis protein CheA [Fibrobacteria bacterium]|nr:chemotaxis protein CheA [Fibrobacteria bacterium]
MDLDILRSELILESRELLAEMETALLKMEREGPTREHIDALFRVAHTIKGSVGIFGLDHIVAFTHAMETALDAFRNGSVPCTGEHLGLFLECADHLERLIEGLERNTPPEEIAHDVQTALEARLLRISKTSDPEPRRGASSSNVPAERPPLRPEIEILEGRAGPEVDNQAWHISLRPSPDLLRHGVDPLALISYLSEFGKVLAVEVVDDRLPDLEEMDPTEAYLGFEIRFSTEADRSRIVDAFSFVSKGSRLRILPPRARIDAYLELMDSAPHSSKRLGEILVEVGALTEQELEKALAMQKAAPSPPPPLGKILVGEQIVPPEVVAAALDHQKRPPHSPGGLRSTLVKVDSAKLDSLIDLVGELVISSAAAHLAARSEGAKASLEALAQMVQLVEEIRDCSLGLRMVAVGEVFQRFPRMVRDLAKDLGKSVRLEITGAETELDKSMVDRLADPLTHIVRNALDHALEPPSARASQGKPEEGTLGFHAYHQTGSIVIEVRDDGAGIDRKRVLARARERGLVQPDQILSDSQILDLIFQPGFSTANTVSNLSGRGVGMDVVRKTIEGMRGTIELESTLGAGTTIRLRLPLTLAIIDGFLVSVASRSFVVPLDMVVECADLDRSAAALDGSRALADLRGHPLPLLDLRRLYSLPDPTPARRNILVVEYGSRRAGLVVDRLVGEFQTVIKALPTAFGDPPGVGGTTILGTGEVALILDIATLVQMASTRTSSGLEPASTGGRA